MSNSKIKLIVQGKIPRDSKDGEDYSENMGKKCKAKEYIFYSNAYDNTFHVMDKTSYVSIPLDQLDISIIKDNFKEVIKEKNGKLTSQILWFWKGDNTASVWEWFNWYFAKKKEHGKRKK